ncbi:hypothetical protein ACM66B_000943 [Microbotryomycetes sp. NB124-2]
MTSSIDKENRPPNQQLSHVRKAGAPFSASVVDTRPLNDPVMEKIKAQVRQSRRDSHDARNKLLSIEQELGALNKVLKETEQDKMELREAVQFAEAEAKTSKQACQELEREVEDLTNKLVTAGAQLDDVINERDSLKSQLETCRKELSDALRGLESAYDRALTEVEDWKRQHGFQSTSYLSTSGSDSVCDSIIHEEEASATSEPSSSDGEVYDFVREEDVTITLSSNATNIRPPFRRAKNLGHKLRRLMTMSRSAIRLNSNQPSRHAVQLFAERELEDDYADHQQTLLQLAEAVATTPPDQVKYLNKLRARLDDTIHLMRLSATKLEAVKSLRR